MSEQVRTMFAEIAPTYDKANSVLSMGVHHGWRRRTVEASGAAAGMSGLKEMARVVRPGGSVVVLEFGQPTGLFGAVYNFYGRHVIPTIGGAISGSRDAYEYLPRTSAAFPAGPRFLELMDRSGAFSSATFEPLTMGIAVLYRGVVASTAG